MKFRDIRVWLYVFGLTALVAIYLYQQSMSHRKELESQSIKAVILGKNNLQAAFHNYQYQLDEYLSRNYLALTGGSLADQAEKIAAIFDGNPKFKLKQIRILSKQEAAEKQFEALQSRVVLRDSSSSLLVENYFFDLAGKIPGGNIGNEFFVGEADVEKRFDASFFSIPADGEARSLTFLVEHELPFYRLMEDNLPLRFFDRLFLLDAGGVVVYPARYRGRILLDPATMDHTSAIDAESNMPVVKAGEQLFKMNLGAEEFEAFVSPFLLAGGQYYLMGLKESVQFQRAAYRIDFSVLSVLVLVLVLVLFGIPVIGIFSLSAGDVLSKGKVIGIGLSLIFLALVAGYTFGFIQNQRTSEFDGELLSELVDEVSRQFKDYDSLLHRFSEIEDKDEVAKDTLIGLPVNEYIQFSSGGFIEKLGIPGTAMMGLGDQSFINIQHRDYVIESKRNPSKVFLSAHYSNATGALEGVVSLFRGETGNAITFNVSGLVSSEMSKHRFFVFKPDGKVIMKSAGMEMPVNNLQDAIEEGVWFRIQALLENNAARDRSRTWEMPLYVNGHEYQAVFKRLDFDGFSSEVWVMYLVDKSLQDSLYILTTFETLAFLFPYLLVLGLLVSFVFLASLQPIYLRMREFSFDWYRPTPSKRNQYLFANYVLAFHLVGFLFVYLVIPLTLFSIFLWSALIAISGSICNFVLLFPDPKRGLGSREFNFLAPALFVFLLLVCGLGVLNSYALEGRYFYLSTLMLTLLGVAVTLCLVTSAKGRMPRLKPDFSGKIKGWKRIHFRLTKMWNFITQLQVEKRIFSLNFLLWIIVLGFLPGYAIHRQVFVQEVYIWNAPLGGEQQTPGIRPISGFYRDLISIHEQLRRVNFSRLTYRTDEELRGFLAPDIRAIEASFMLPKQLYYGSGKSSQSASILHLISQKIGQTPVFLLTTFLLMGLFFNLIMRVSKRLFLVDYLFPVQNKRLPTACVTRKFTFVIGLDSKKIGKWIRYHYLTGKSQMLVLSAMEDGSSWPEEEVGYHAVLLENLHCLETAAEVLEVLERFKERFFERNILLFISSGRSIQDLMGPGTAETVVLRITEIMKPFLFYVVPLNFHQEVLLLPHDGGGWAAMSEENRRVFREKVKSPLFNDPLVTGLSEELIYGENRAALACLLTDELLEESLESRVSQDRYEKCILSIQRYNKAFFINVWSKLNMREKKLCYYFALEGFINYTMRDVMASLLQKGVLSLDPTKDRLRLFSLAFTNFVLANTAEEELEAFRREEKAKGTSRLVQAASISFVFISVSVIGFYDPNILDRSVAYVSAAIGLSGTIYSFFQKGFKSIWSGDS
ncbi:hypothetical protein [Lunatimonas salinarum]|uniref:hypothetical protein n=1 Tax=Lunatimonas salinarum TaxID=1774590 RepID=UPI001ADF68D8|nr:hypothetical protein [Lunatimonas salinarum]